VKKLPANKYNIPMKSAKEEAKTVKIPPVIEKIVRLGEKKALPQ
jgi:hypothetical protein